MTRPNSLSLERAPCGQAATQAGSSQWLHDIEREPTHTSGNSPPSWSVTLRKNVPMGRSFLSLHATWQQRHPVHSLTFWANAFCAMDYTSTTRKGHSQSGASSSPSYFSTLHRQLFQAWTPEPVLMSPTR